MQPTTGGPIKIGTTKDVEVRHGQLQKHYSCPLVVLATVEGGRKEEAEIHARFAHLRLGRTEQFQPSAELLEFIGRPIFAAAGDITEVKPLESPRRIIMLVSPEYDEWLERRAVQLRTTKSGAIDRMLAEWAAAESVESPPARIARED